LNINDTGDSLTDTLIANGTVEADNMELAHYYLKSGTETINFINPDTLEHGVIQAGDGKDLFLLLCDRFTVEYFGGLGDDSMTVNHFEQPTTLDGGDGGDSYQVNFGNLLATLSIDDQGLSGTDEIQVKAPGASLLSWLSEATTWYITPSQVTNGSESLTYSATIESLKFLGSPGDEEIQVTPSATTKISIDGGGQVTGDRLVIDAGGRPYTSQPGQIDVATLQSVIYLNIQIVQVINSSGIFIYLPMVSRLS
jgi:hypothetical protein